MQQSILAQPLAVQNPYFITKLQPLEPLPYPVYFVTKKTTWQDLIDHPELLNSETVESLFDRCDDTGDIWSAQVYMDLKQRGLDVHLVSRPVPGAICVVPYYYLDRQDALPQSYIVGCRHDSPIAAFSDQQIVINRLQVHRSTDHWLPHRPQPNLKPRHLERGTMIQNLAFKGHAYNLYAPFQTPEFLAELSAMGMRLVVNTEENPDSRFAEWSNYTEADVVLAIRNNTVYDIALKPALKLINAWFAGCPAILGPEPAYQDIRQSELDYIEVRTPDEVIAALKRLKENPGLYQAMIENGFRRAQEFTVDRTSLKWRNLLAGPVAQGYEAWLHQSSFQQQFVRPVRHLWRSVHNRLAAKYYVHHIHNGTRILSGRA